MARYDILHNTIKSNLDDKIKCSTIVRGRNTTLSLEVFVHDYSDAMVWNQYLNNARRAVQRIFHFDRPLIPLPVDYHPNQYAQYEKELDDYVENYLVQLGYHNVYGHVFNMGTVAAPLMHLVLSKGPLRREHLGVWVQTWSDDEEARVGAPPSAPSLASNMESRNDPPPGSNSDENGASVLETDTYQLRKRLAELTKNPTERVRAPSAPSTDDPKSLSDEATANMLSEGLSDNDDENSPEEPENEPEVVDDAVALEEVVVASEGGNEPEAELENDEMVELDEGDWADDEAEDDDEDEEDDDVEDDEENSEEEEEDN